MFSLAWPWLFVLFPLPWILRRSLPATKSQARYIQVPFTEQLNQLTKAFPTPWYQRTRSYFLPILVWCFLLASAVRPQIISQPEQFPSNGRDFLILLDVSSSMQMEDSELDGVMVSRLELVQNKLSTLIQQRTGDRFGLILFGSNAYVQAPLTLDQNSVIFWLNDAVPGIAGKNTAMGDAIGLAIKRLQEQEAKQRVAILVTDGANNSGVMHPLAAAKLAANLNIKIYTLGVGTPQAAEDDNPLDLDFDQETLEKIAAMTSAIYSHVADDLSFNHFLRLLDEHYPHEQPQQWRATVKELFPYPLTIAFFLSLLLSLQRIRLAQGAQDV